MHRLRNMACVRGIGPYQLGLRRDRGVRLVAPTAQRLRRDPRSLATCSIALVSDEYEPRDSVNSLTAFASNSGVYLVPFAMVPSSPIELGEMRNKNQFISPHIPSQERLFLRDISCESEVGGGGEKLHVSMPAWLEGIMAPRQTKAKLMKRKTGKPMLDWILKHG